MNSEISQLSQEEPRLKYLHRINEFNSGEHEEFRRIINKLMGSTFMVKKKQDTRKDYYFIERNERLFREFLELAGWSLVCDTTLGVYQAISEFKHNRQDLNLQQSIITLIVRLCYEEKQKELSLSKDIIVRTDEIHEKYAALKIRNKPIDKQSFREGIGLLKRFNVLDNLDRNILDPECRFIVYPSIVMAVRVDDISSVYKKIKGYSTGETNDSEEFFEEGEAT